ncbi:tRNA ligase [Xylariaceae sp. FL0255]|nr:tRNA ligase [Xylariaceae sp. FL0255]
MDSVKVPYVDQDPHLNSELVKNLNDAIKQKKGFKAKKTTFNIAGSRDGIRVDSWRFQDWDYKRKDLPTYARGLFTARNRQNGHEIVTRGYDKFFNVDEVADTKWDVIKTQTRGPYELTLKENGCIIFISGLEDDTLLVCSKHSTGDRSDVEVSHASAGEGWVDKQLATLGKTRQDLARELKRRNVTAVAELCDDDFEEHILAYGADKAGLYLHGMNLNTPEFVTYPSNLVQQFADDWGFRKVGLQVFEDVDTVKTFLEGVAESGAHEGRDVEGFVIRCQKLMNRSDQYQDWFFKYKFEEPYLMYRQWRECTKAVICGKPPKFKKHARITEEYLLFSRRRLAQDKELRKLYQQNHGIINLRNEFLAYKNMKGSDAANFEALYGGGSETSSVSENVVLVPIATIGCGKTTVGQALTYLFGWSIVQNDNIQGKGRPAKMTEAVLSQLRDHPVVISDRNNAERREREQIIKDVTKVLPGATMVALNFVHDNMDEVRMVTQRRVLERGDNHQTIQAATEKDKVLGIMENFIHRFQPCNPDNFPDHHFGLVIDLVPTAGSRANVETVITKLREKYPLLIPTIPSPEDIDAAVKGAIEDYVPEIRHVIPDRTSKRDQKQQVKQQAQLQKALANKKKKPLEYMSVNIPPLEVRAALESVFKDADLETSRFYQRLKQLRRIQPLFHVTLMHRAASKEHPELWAQYTALEAASGDDDKLGDCDVMLERVVFSDRIMAIVVRLQQPQGEGESQKWTCVNKVAHITVGTADNSVKPKESNDLLAKWLQVGSGGDTGIGERVIAGMPTLKGSVRAVLSR